MAKKTETHRNSKSKGEDTEVERTAQGVAFTPARYEPGEAVITTDVSGYHRFTMSELDFLDKYEEAVGDIKQIMALTGRSRASVDNLLAKDAIRAEISELQSVWRLNRKMRAEHAAAKLISLVDELEADYRKIECPVDRAKMATPRVKAIESYLKASGHFNHNTDTVDNNIVINIDLGNDEVEVSKGEETAKVKKVKKKDV